jgi:rhodanese-related sulfurtransferase
VTDASTLARDAGLPALTALDQPDHPRHVLLERSFNTRDLGGLIALGGRAVRPGQLYRADGIHRVGDADVARFIDLGVRTVLDLRTPHELDEWGVFPDTVGVTHHHLPVLQQTWDRLDLPPVEGEDQAVAFLVARYAEMFEEGAPALATALDLIADPDHRAVVFHCAAGKDRTGVLAMVTLALLGVSDEDIAADYHLSSHGTARWLAWVGDTRPEVLESMADQPVAYLQAPPEVALQVLAAVRAEHGSVEGYVAAIGVPDATVERLRTSLLEPAG